jgi:hypothetical protein
VRWGGDCAEANGIACGVEALLHVQERGDSPHWTQVSCRPASRLRQAAMRRRMTSRRGWRNSWTPWAKLLSWVDSFPWAPHSAAAEVWLSHTAFDRFSANAYWFKKNWLACDDMPTGRSSRNHINVHCVTWAISLFHIGFMLRCCLFSGCSNEPS